MDGAGLKEQRSRAGMTQEAFADAIGMTRVMIGLMERGQAPIERRTALAARMVAIDAEGEKR